MSLLGLNRKQENEYNVTESVNLFDGSVEELLTESANAIHGIFEAMYDMDVAELSHNSDCVAMESNSEVEILFESTMSEKFKKVKDAMFVGIDAMATVVLKVINGAIELLSKLKKTNAEWLKEATKGKEEVESSFELKGFDFPHMGEGVAVAQLEIALNDFNGVFGVAGPHELCVKEGDKAQEVFKAKKEEGLHSALGALCGKDSVTPAEFKAVCRVAAFGSETPVDVKVDVARAKELLSKEIDGEISALKKQKSATSKAFSDMKKSLNTLDKAMSKEEGNNSQAIPVVKAFISSYNVIKSYYVMRIKIGMQAANIASSQSKKVIMHCYKEKKTDNK